jgi:site-specific recombinase XerD
LKADIEDLEGLEWTGVDSKRVSERVRFNELHEFITGDGVYKMLKRYAAKAGITVDGLCLHALRATAATNALENKSDIAFM